MLSIKQCKELVYKNTRQKRLLFYFGIHYTFRITTFTNDPCDPPNDIVALMAHEQGFRTCIVCGLTMHKNNIKNIKHIGDYYKKTCSKDCHARGLDAVNCLKRTRTLHFSNSRIYKRSQISIMTRIISLLSSDLVFSLFRLILDYAFTSRQVKKFYRKHIKKTMELV